MHIGYDLQLIHQDPNLVVFLIIQISVWSHPIILGPQRNIYIGDPKSLFWPQTSFTFKAFQSSPKIALMQYFAYIAGNSQVSWGAGGW